MQFGLVEYNLKEYYNYLCIGLKYESKEFQHKCKLKMWLLFKYLPEILLKNSEKVLYINIFNCDTLYSETVRQTLYFQRKIKYDLHSLEVNGVYVVFVIIILSII